MGLRIVFALFFLAACNRPCNKISFKKAIRRNLISDDIATLFFDIKPLACPKFQQGNPQECPPIISTSSNSWDPRTPDEVLFSMFFVDSQYSYCEEIFKDPFLLDALQSIPEPTEQAISWFKDRLRGPNIYFWEIDDKVNSLSLDYVQRKMISVFYHVSSWNFCPASRTEEGKTIHGIYNPTTRSITMYRTACLAGNIYGSNIKSAALTHRFFFIGSHELGHAIDHLSGKLKNKTKDEKYICEVRANVIGLILTKGVCRLLNGRLKFYNTSVTANGENLKPCDLELLQSLIVKWKNIELYFDKLISEAKNNFIKKDKYIDHKENLWASWGCVE